MAISRVESIGAGVSGAATAPAQQPAAAISTGQQAAPTAIDSMAAVSTQMQFGTSSQPQTGEQQAGQETSKEPAKEDLNFVSESMNHFMKLMNADLQFSVHEKTHRVMVKLVDESTKEVLKEFPPEEFLDMVAKIQEYVGMLVDKKA